MTLIKQPSELTNTGAIAGMIYGQPGLGKSTLGCSSPDTLLIDADRGAHRIEKRLQVPTLPMSTYQELLDLMNSDEIAPFKTITFDTLGKLVDKMSTHLGEVDAKNLRKDGSLSMQGWGALKIEFQKLLKLAQSKNKNLIFIAHEKEEKDGDVRIVRPDVAGSSGKDLVKDLDFMGYMEMKSNKRTVSFSPSEKFYAKNSLQLPAVIDVPDTSKNANDFLQKFIFDKTKERLAVEAGEAKKYETMLAAQLELAAAVSNVKEANDLLAQLSELPEMWDTKRRVKKALSDKTKALGLEYSKEKAAFVKSEAKQETVAETKSEPAAETKADDKEPVSQPTEKEAKKKGGKKAA